MILSSSQLDAPEDFEAALAPLGGRTWIRREGRQPFGVKLRAAGLQAIGLMDLAVSPLRVTTPDEKGFFGLTIPLTGGFDSRRGRSRDRFSGSVSHLTSWDEPFELSFPVASRLLVVNFKRDELLDYGARASARPRDEILLPASIQIDTPEGRALRRYLSFVWGEIDGGGGALRSSLARSEIEDTLSALFLWASEASANAPVRRRTAHGATDYVDRVAEYLAANLDRPVSRVELAEMAGVSVRTLARAFKKRFGVGPIAFLYARRLEAARRDLRLAEPGSTTVTEVALRYGLDHMGRFARDYRRAFGELPSEALRR